MIGLIFLHSYLGHHGVHDAPAVADSAEIQPLVLISEAMYEVLRSDFSGEGEAIEVPQVSDIFSCDSGMLQDGWPISYRCHSICKILHKEIECGRGGGGGGGGGE